MYSEVLAQIDRNTERLMVDEMKQEVEELKQEAEELKQENENLKKKYALECADIARKLLNNGVPYELVRNSFDAETLSDEILKKIYDEVMAEKAAING